MGRTLARQEVLMAADRSYVTRNTAERERLRALVEELGDEELSRPLAAGWTIAGVLAHVAFWDQRALVLLERWEEGGDPPRAVDPADVDWINDAMKPLCLALPPHTAAQLALAIAETVDWKVETLSDDRLAANATAGHPVNLLRAEHRREHLGDIERALGG
jgi:DinB superfamily